MRAAAHVFCRLPPGPFPLPLVGSLYAFPLSDMSRAPFRMAKLAQKYDKMFSLIAPNAK